MTERTWIVHHHITKIGKREILKEKRRASNG